MVIDILYIESLKDHVRLVTTTEQLIAKQTISSLEAILPDDYFLRIHWSYIVAVNKIDSYSPTHIEVAGKELPIGRHYKHEAEQVLR